jgi:integrase
MPRPKNPIPTPRQHKGRAVVDLYDNGTRRTVTLGAWGSPEAEREFARILAEGRSTPAQPVAGKGATVNEVLLAFLRHADGYYRTPDGEPTNEVVEVRQSIRPVRELYGHTPAAEFGPKALAAVRQRMIDADLCRTLVNRRIDRVKRVFKWASAEELVPVTVYQSLRTLAGLRRGRSEVRESDPVLPVDNATVDATLPYLNAHLLAMVELQRLTGMRPGEVCALRFAEIDRSGDVWLFRPRQHKTAHHGRERVIPIGPKARGVLLAFLLREGQPPDGFGHVEPNDPEHRNARRVMADAYEEAGRVRDTELLRDVCKSVLLIGGCVVDPAVPLFSPAEARAEWARTARRNRKSKVPPSQVNRRKANPARVPGAEYTVAAYGYAVRKAAGKAGVPHWHPNQLRHTFATAVRKAHGLEAAQVLLGHSRADVTQVYAERDTALAAAVAAKIG